MIDYSGQSPPITATHVHFSYPWHAFASHGLPAIAELLVVSLVHCWSCAANQASPPHSKRIRRRHSDYQMYVLSAFSGQRLHTECFCVCWRRGSVNKNKGKLAAAALLEAGRKARHTTSIYRLTSRPWPTDLTLLEDRSPVDSWWLNRLHFKCFVCVRFHIFYLHSAAWVAYRLYGQMIIDVRTIALHVARTQMDGRITSPGDDTSR